MKLFLYLVVLLSFVVPAAQAQGLVAHPKCHSLRCIAASQKENLAHARYVCNHGRHASKRWACAAQKWLEREYKETEAALHPQPATSHLDGWICIHNGEGAWDSNTGNGFLGGLQMTPGWGGVARPDLLSPGAQIALADGVAQKYKYADWWMRQQWPNTYPPCYSHFH